MKDTIYACYADKVSENPNAIAIFDEKCSLTRKELEQLIDTIAVKIPENIHRVGIMMEHSVEMIATIFAVLKRGNTYVPVEPFFPQKRIDFMMEDAQVEVIITNSTYKEKVGKFSCIIIDSGLKAENVVAEASAALNDLAYILYTSGSTGVPKGIAVYNRNVCHYVRAFQHEFHPAEKDIMLQYSVCSFDIFVEEVFATILSGSVLAIPSADTKKDIHSLMEFVNENNVTIISGFPYLLLEMNHLPYIPESLRLLISGGDILRAGYISNLIDKVAIYNTYGPSETTVCASYFRCNGMEQLSDGTYPIGKSVLGTQIEILDTNMKPVNIGEIGEICILGGGVSAGYIGNRKKENEAFVKKQDGTILYRSGDLGYFLPDGNIAFIHRKDTQVMILGKRVEPIEVESVLYKCSEIEKAVVKANTDEQKLSYMVAYIVLKQSSASLSTLKKEMARFLPNYMIPEFFVRMVDIPLNSNGKVDENALPIIMKEGFAV